MDQYLWMDFEDFKAALLNANFKATACSRQGGVRVTSSPRIQFLLVNSHPGDKTVSGEEAQDITGNPLNIGWEAVTTRRLCGGH